MSKWIKWTFAAALFIPGLAITSYASPDAAPAAKVEQAAPAKASQAVEVPAALRLNAPPAVDCRHPACTRTADCIRICGDDYVCGTEPGNQLKHCFAP